jgi:hypothetical protein
MRRGPGPLDYRTTGAPRQAVNLSARVDVSLHTALKRQYVREHAKTVTVHGGDDAAE